MPKLDLLSSNLLEFVGRLRDECGFGIGHADARDALRAIEHVGIENGGRVRAALRSVCCSSPREIETFERAFDAFFLSGLRGVPNPSYAPRHTRPDGAPESRVERKPPRETPADAPAVDEPGGGAPSKLAVVTGEENDAVAAWRLLRANSSPHAAKVEPPALERDGFDAMLAAAGAWVAAARLGRSRSFRPDPHGARFDVRRTLRASLQTAGDPFTVHRLGHPRRAPRFVMLLDGSRSMLDFAGPYLQFAAALVRRTRRASAFAFSTELREVTEPLRRTEPGSRIDAPGEAWGGGTRIGASLQHFLGACGNGRLNENTILAIASDGLDAGDAAGVEGAMREFARRCAAVVWLNPHAGDAGYEPSALAMRLALPSISLLSGAHDAAGLRALAPQLARAAAGR